MNAREIEEGLAGSLGNGIIFLGCITDGDILKYLRCAMRQNKGCVFILFVEGSSNTEIGHWVAVYINFAEKSIGYYDTYNLNLAITSPTLYSFIQRFPCLKLTTLAYRIQSVNSLVCGAYAMYFTYLISHKNHLDKVWNILHRTFKRNTFISNDKIIIRLAYRLFTIPHCSQLFCNGGPNTLDCMRHFCD